MMQNGNIRVHEMHNRRLPTATINDYDSTVNYLRNSVEFVILPLCVKLMDVKLS